MIDSMQYSSNITRFVLAPLSHFDYFSLEYEFPSADETFYPVFAVANAFSGAIAAAVLALGSARFRSVVVGRAADVVSG